MEYRAPPPPLRACYSPGKGCCTLFLFAGGHLIP
nr:MAG TPA: hypothetical protein [Caudoviricetes sp.]